MPVLNVAEETAEADGRSASVNSLKEHLLDGDALSETGTKFPTATLIVGRVFSRPKLRWVIALLWLALTAGGLGVFQDFMSTLESSVPPVPGTLSYVAAGKLSQYFDNSALTIAVLAQSTDHSPLFDMVPRSTCDLKFDEFAITKPKDVHNHGNFSAKVKLTCIPRDPAALGGGCITNTALVDQLLAMADNVTRHLPQPVPPGVEKALAETLRELMRVLTVRFNVNVSHCPVAVPGKAPAPRVEALRGTGRSLTRDWLDFGARLNSSLAAQFPQCELSAFSLDSLVPALTESVAVNRTYQDPWGVLSEHVVLDADVTVPPGALWGQFLGKAMAQGNSATLMGVQVTSCAGAPVPNNAPLADDIAEATKALTLPGAMPASLEAKVSSQSLMVDSIKAGIKDTMDLSTRTLPIALVVLAAMVRNVRLVVCTVVNLAATIASAILLMYPIAKTITVPTVAPTMMVAVALAMSIDYSLFLLSRFQHEVDAGRTVAEAVATMLATSGKIVLVSGLTLVLCFLMMLCLPVALISSMGLSASITVLLAVAAALTLTPVMLMAFPICSSASRRWGLTGDGCCIGCPCRCACCDRHCPIPASRRRSHAPSLNGGMPRASRMSDLSGDFHVASVDGVDHEVLSMFWTRCGTLVQRAAWPIIVVLVALAVPIGVVALPQFAHSCGLVPLMPSTSNATHSLLTLQDAFGVGALYPTTIVMIPPAGATSRAKDRKAWLSKACDALKTVAEDTDEGRPASSGAPPFTADAFTGVMILNGNCVKSAQGSQLGHWNDYHDKFGKYAATKVLVSYPIDPFSAEGQEWLVRMRTAAARREDVGEWHISSEGANQMDVANKTFSRLPLMISLMMVVVLILIGVSFRSILAPIRAVVCTLWMLIVCFGLAIFVFQGGVLDSLGWSQLGQRSTGAMYWMSPCIAFSILVGLGLDYDIFYSERVIEECEHGYPVDVAAVRALAATANTISAAGVIMAFAFLSLLLSTTPTLNEIAFLLIVGVIIDCAITTKLIIPAVMAVLGKNNFWPRRFSADRRRSLLQDQEQSDVAADERSQ